MAPPEKAASEGTEFLDSATAERPPEAPDGAGLPVPGSRRIEFRLFFELTQYNFRTLLLLTFLYDEEIDWYEIKVFRGQEMIGYVHGYANQGWNPQVNNIWVIERFRRRGIGSLMMARVEDYFGQAPLPGTPISDNEPARLFWRKYLAEEPDAEKDEDL
jgi:GNAT superfamily N-acetyltransferase